VAERVHPALGWVGTSSLARFGLLLAVLAFAVVEDGKARRLLVEMVLVAVVFVAVFADAVVVLVVVQMLDPLLSTLSESLLSGSLALLLLLVPVPSLAWWSPRARRDCREPWLSVLEPALAGLPVDGQVPAGALFGPLLEEQAAVQVQDLPVAPADELSGPAGCVLQLWMV